VLRFFALYSNQTEFETHGASFLDIFSLDINRPGCEVRHSPLSGAEIQEIWSYVYISLYAVTTNGSFLFN
jgi:hypothetical protein